MPWHANSDQGSVFTSSQYESLLEGRHVLQRMDGNARWVDNVIVERWFRSLKTECLRISEYETPAQLRQLIAGYVERYNDTRPHQSFDYDMPG